MKVTIYGVGYVGYPDLHVPVIQLSREYSHFAGLESAAWNKDAVSEYEVAKISTAHSAVNHAQLTEWIPYVVDTAKRNVMAGSGAIIAKA